MKKSYVLVLTLFSLLSANLYAAEKDAAGCKDHPLLPRLPGYIIVACGAANASFDLETVGESSETIHIEGNSWAAAYRAPAELEPKPGREEILSRFERAAGKFGVTLMGKVNSTPVYKLADGGKEIWVVVMADPAGGGYRYRVIEKEDLVRTKEEENDDPLNCAKQYGPPLFAPLQGYSVCGCGEKPSGAREFKTKEGKTILVEGKITQMTYCPRDERKALSGGEIRGHFATEIKTRRGALIGKGAKDARVDVYKLAKAGEKTWVEVWVEEDGSYNCVATRKGN